MKAVKDICSKVKWVWRDSRRVRKIARDLITQNGDHLRAGIWKIRWVNNKGLLIRNSKEAADFYRDFCERCNAPDKVRIRNLLANLICVGWKYRSPGSSSPVFTADCVVVSISGSPLFFDLQKMILKRYYEKGNSGYYMLKEAGYWEHFQSPVLGIEGGVSYEKVIRSCRQPTGKENEEKQFQYILQKYGEYFDTAQPVGCCTVAELAIPYRSWVPRFDRIFTQSVLKLQLNCYMQHGDIQQDNLIWDRFGDMYIVDYEMTSVQPFFQDILYYASFRTCIGFDDWRLQDDLMDSETETGLLFDALLNRQQIPANRMVKLAFLILSRLVVPSIVDGSFSTERDMDRFIRSREQSVIRRMVTHFLGDEIQLDV